jgi:hypothetical protein
MRPLTKDPIFNSKELNKILPSYLLDEIDKEDKKDLNHKNGNEPNEFSIKKESETKISNNKFKLFFINVGYKYK